jgi:hypothetical protein
VSNDYLLLIAQFVVSYSVINLLHCIWITLNEVKVFSLYSGKNRRAFSVSLTVCCMVFIYGCTHMDEGYLYIGLQRFYKVSEVVDRILVQFLP